MPVHCPALYRCGLGQSSTRDKCSHSLLSLMLHFRAGVTNANAYRGLEWSEWVGNVREWRVTPWLLWPEATQLQPNVAMWKRGSRAARFLSLQEQPEICILYKILCYFRVGNWSNHFVIMNVGQTIGICRPDWNLGYHECHLGTSVGS